MLLEVRADDTPAIEAVLSADTKRSQLLAEEKRLVEESEAGNDSNSERLKQVYIELEAIGAASAEARARRILAVSWLPWLLVAATQGRP